LVFIANLENGAFRLGNHSKIVVVVVVVVVGVVVVVVVIVVIVVQVVISKVGCILNAF
jgi:hypothetical protein